MISHCCRWRRTATPATRPTCTQAAWSTRQAAMSTASQVYLLFVPRILHSLHCHSGARRCRLGMQLHLHRRQDAAATAECLCMLKSIVHYCSLLSGCRCRRAAPGHRHEHRRHEHRHRHEHGASRGDAGQHPRPPQPLQQQHQGTVCCAASAKRVPNVCVNMFSSQSRCHLCLATQLYRGAGRSAGRATIHHMCLSS